MSQTLGEKLRRTREERGISISEVAEQTRISPHYIKSIENDDYKPLPGGIFNKGFIKSYAKYIGLDETEALQDYAKLTVEQDEQEPESNRSYRPEVLTDDIHSASRAPTIIFAAIILALMTGGILFVVRFLQNKNDQPAANVNATVNSNAPAEVNADANAAVTSTPDKISIQLTAKGEPIWIRYKADETTETKTLAAGESVTVEPMNSFAISYSKSKADKVSIRINGKEVAPPMATTKGIVEFVINKANVSEIVQTGQIKAAATPSATPRAAVRPAPKATVSPKASPPARANANRQ